MGFIIKILAVAVAVYLTAHLLPGVVLRDVQTAVIVALVLAVFNAIVKPVLVVLTLPITILTLGLFLLIINIIIVKLADYFIDGFAVHGWLTALLFSFIVSFISAVITKIVGGKN
ncbi:phage holin family protein [Flavisolibacter ginsenosidimutans]|uniref:Phage holin family protein n=1 Tax=Flavisolibacter ginsenosidimutans TaxID=661481 RepID=A0A5B8ULF3_9BACT|nr:phage holin family protein [Flavisolibacter ginsenosidimutans]QEC57393.1 phage holin family protein [Flavisolibacter ginsenosidimutans]